MAADSAIPLVLFLFAPVAYALVGLVLFVVRFPVASSLGSSAQRCREARFLRSVIARRGEL